MSEVDRVASERRKSARIKLGLLCVLCAAPIVASYLAYYVVRPGARDNYGALIDPQRPIPPLHLTASDGHTFALESLSGRWLMLVAGGADCAQACTDQLYLMRQVRAMTGRERDRIERIRLVTDGPPEPAPLPGDYEGTIVLRVDPAELRAWLPGDAQDQLGAHIYLVDPHGHLMMRFPANPDPYRVKRDLTRLLAASMMG